MKTSLFAAATLFAGASAGHIGGQRVDDDVFEIKSAQPDHIHAEFWNLGYRNRHIGEKSAETLFYDVATGEALFQLTVGETASTIQYLDHEPITWKGHHGQTTKQAMLEQEEDGTGYARALGRHALHAHPTFAMAIGKMAIAVGQRGIYGNSHPAAYYLYSVAMKFEQNRRGEHDLQPPVAPAADEPINLLEVEAETHLEVEAGTQLNMEAKSEIKQAWPGFGWIGGVVGMNRRRRRRREKTNTMRSYHGYFDNKNDLYSNFKRCLSGYGYPGRKDPVAGIIAGMGQWAKKRVRCFGYCGPGCECWIFICGRCDRIYQGCTEHDCICAFRCDGDMIGDPTNSNKSWKGAKNTIVTSSNACNSLNTYQDWGCYRNYAQAVCQYNTQHVWWNDGDCAAMPQTHQPNRVGTVSNKNTSQYNNRLYTWGVGGHFPGLVNRMKKKAKKFNYFLEYHSQFVVPTAWSSQSWWQSQSIWSHSATAYSGQGYQTPSEGLWGTQNNSNGGNLGNTSSTWGSNHQSFLANEGFVTGTDYVFVMPYGHRFFPSASTLSQLGYDSWHYTAIRSTFNNNVGFPGCGIDASRITSGYADAVNVYNGLNAVNWTQLGHHGYAQPAGNPQQSNYGNLGSGGSTVYHNSGDRIYEQFGKYRSDSTHNMWYYSSGDEGELSVSRPIVGGEGKPNYQADWNHGALDQPAIMINGSYAAAYLPNTDDWPLWVHPPKKSYSDQSYFSDVLWSGSFAAVVGDQFLNHSAGETDYGVNAGESGSGCMVETYHTFPTPAPTKAPTHYPSPAPSHAPTPSPSPYPTAAPTTSPTENPNWGNCCATSLVGQIWLDASAQWQGQYPTYSQAGPIAPKTGLNPWLGPVVSCNNWGNLPSVDLTTMSPLKYPWNCANMVKWGGWYTTPGNAVPGPDYAVGGCEWIPLGGVGGYKCPHKTGSGTYMGNGQGGIGGNPTNTVGPGPILGLSPASGLTYPPPNGLNPPAPNSPAAVTFAWNNNNNIPPGVTLPNNNGPTTMYGGKGGGGAAGGNNSGSKQIDNAMLSDGTFLGSALLRGDVSGVPQARRGEYDSEPAGWNGPDAGDDDGDHNLENTPPAYRLSSFHGSIQEKEENWVASGEENYPFYMGASSDPNENHDDGEQHEDDRKVVNTGTDTKANLLKNFKKEARKQGRIKKASMHFVKNKWMATHNGKVQRS